MRTYVVNNGHEWDPGPDGAKVKPISLIHQGFDETDIETSPHELTARSGTAECQLERTYQVRQSGSTLSWVRKVPNDLVLNYRSERLAAEALQGLNHEDIAGPQGGEEQRASSSVWMWPIPIDVHFS